MLIFMGVGRTERNATYRSCGPAMHELGPQGTLPWCEEYTPTSGAQRRLVVCQAGTLGKIFWKGLRSVPPKFIC